MNKINLREYKDPLIGKKRELAQIILNVEKDADAMKKHSKERMDLLGFQATLRLELSQLWGFCK